MRAGTPIRTGGTSGPGFFKSPPKPTTAHARPLRTQERAGGQSGGPRLGVDGVRGPPVKIGEPEARGKEKETAPRRLSYAEAEATATSNTSNSPWVTSTVKRPSPSSSTAQHAARFPRRQMGQGEPGLSPRIPRQLEHPRPEMRTTMPQRTLLQQGRVPKERGNAGTRPARTSRSLPRRPRHRRHGRTHLRRGRKGRPRLVNGRSNHARQTAVSQ